MAVTFSLIDATTLDPALVDGFNQAAADWSADLVGDVTLRVYASVGAFPGNLGYIVQDDPGPFGQIGTSDGRALVEPYGQYALATGTHFGGTTVDIGITFSNSPGVNGSYGLIDAATLFRKAIAYGIGFNTMLTTNAPGARSVTPLDQYVRDSGGAAFYDAAAILPDVSGVLALFGPTAMAVYGGPVPLTTPPPGYVESNVHIGNTPTIAGGVDLMGVTQSLQGRKVPISMLDLAILEDAGVAINAQLFAVVAAQDIVAASAGTALFTITRPNPAAALTVYASTNANAGSSNAGSYVELVNQPVQFAAGQRSATVAVTLNGAVGSTFTLSISASPDVLSRLGTASVSITGGAGPPQATVSGPGGTQIFNFDDNASAARAQAGLSLVNSAGLRQVSIAGAFVMAGGTTALSDSATVPVTVFGGATAGQLVVAGSGGLAFNAGAGAGTVIAAGGANLISVYPGAGAQAIFTGSGDDVVAVLAGDNIISAGGGHNQILAQGGNNLISSTGADLIALGSGNSTITAGANDPTVFLGSGAAEFNGGSGHATVVVGSAAATLVGQGGSQFWMRDGGGLVVSSGADTVIGGAGATTVNAASGNDFIFAGSGGLNVRGGGGATTILGNSAGSAALSGGAGSLIAIAYGATRFTGGSGADTIAAFGGSATIAAGSGTGVYLGGPDGHNRIAGGSGRVTIFGGGDGDVLTAGSGPGDVIKAGGGGETISALGSASDETFYGGAGDNLFLFGGGSTRLLAGSGSATIIAGSGTALLAVTAGNAAKIVFSGFDPTNDYLSLVGFAADAAASALAAAETVGGSEKLVLGDGTQILFQGFTGLGLANFL